FWRRTHWMGQTTVVILSLIGIALVLPPAWGEMSTHHILGYGVLASMLIQVLLGVTRGSKGGPTDRSLRGHHYDMTPWRCMFEALHKTLGYITLGLAAVTILLGLWHANAPVWMWGMLALWWPLLAMVFVSLQKRGLAVDTYQAIWGDDPAHPGNARPAPGWGVRRPGDDCTKGDAHVRRDRGDRLRSH
ncbi:MAG: cytochrome b561 domain-containing protein, partial [Pseudomonadota bacterium]